jgi:hypothetical protein
MRSILRVLLATLCLATFTASAANEDAVAKATAAAQAWLAAADAGDAAKTWQSAAKVFQDAIPQAKWGELLASARKPLGAFKSRTFSSATFMTKLPGAPDGEYVVIQYAAQFSGKPSATETITPMKEKDGTWKVSGYYIR